MTPFRSESDSCHAQQQDNRQDHHKKMREYVVSVDEVERLTGLDFFAALPDYIEQRIEAHSDLGDWK